MKPSNLPTEQFANSTETVYQHIWQTLKDTGFSPTLREIEKATGICLSQAYLCVQHLQDQGRLVRSGKRFMPPQIVAVVKSAASEVKS